MVWGGVIKRVLRLYPAYFISVLITSLLMKVLLPERLRSLKDILFNLTLFPGLFGAQYVDGVYWTLQVEIIFYVIVYCFYLLCHSFTVLSKNQDNKNKVFLCFLLGWTFFTLIGLCYPRDIQNRLVRVLCSLLLVHKRSEFFIMGLLLSIKLKQKVRSSELRTFFNEQTLIIINVILCHICAYIEFGMLYGVVWMFFWSSCIFTSVKYQKKITRVYFPIKLLSYCQYPLYLTHQFIGFALIKKLENLGFTNEIFLLFPFTLCVLLACVISFFIEKPFYNKAISYLRGCKNVRK